MPIPCCSDTVFHAFDFALGFFYPICLRRVFWRFLLMLIFYSPLSTVSTGKVCDLVSMCVSIYLSISGYKLSAYDFNSSKVSLKLESLSSKVAFESKQRNPTMWYVGLFSISCLLDFSRIWCDTLSDTIRIGTTIAER